MPDNHTTPGSSTPVVGELIELEQVLREAASELPPVTLAGCLTVVAEVLPYSIGRLQPVCSHIAPTGEHTIPTQFIWKDLETNEVFCHLRCAALEAIAKSTAVADPHV